MTKSYDIYTVLYLGCMSVIYVYMTLKIHANISICICMYDPTNTGTYEHSGSLMPTRFRCPSRPIRPSNGNILHFKLFLFLACRFLIGFWGSSCLD